VIDDGTSTVCSIAEPESEKDDRKDDTDTDDEMPMV
jgi:hypothetical protein